MIRPAHKLKPPRMLRRSRPGAAGKRRGIPATAAGLLHRWMGNHAVADLLQSRRLRAGVVARQPDPPDPGWSDAPEKGLNKEVATVDEKGEMHPGKLASAATPGVWRVPVQGLSQGPQKGDKGTAFESSEGRAIALIPNTVNPAAPDKDKNVAVDVLLHLHGYGVGYRELKPGKQDYAGVLKPGELRDVALYEMEQQLLSHVKASNRLVIAVLAQGSEKSGFGKLGAGSDAYLTEVFAKLVPKYLPQGAMPGRVIASGHSGGGPTAMAVADQRAKAGKRTDVLLFDAINFGCAEKEPVMKDGKQVVEDGKPKTRCVRCESNEYATARQWTTDRISADLSGLAGIPEDQQPAELQKNGARFRGFTSASLKTTSTCSYGYWYNKLKGHIETTIAKSEASEAVRDQLRQNYEVREVSGPHERVMGQGNLEAALKD